MWNPFRAVGDFIGRVSGAVSGGIGKATEVIVDAVKSPFGGREAPSPEQPPSAPPEQPLAPPEPTSLPPAPPTDYEPMLPPSMVGGGEYGGTGEVSGESEEQLAGARDGFVSDQSLGPDALNWLEAPNFSDLFNQYVTGAGFAPDQWIAGMRDVRNVSITDIGDGMIEVSFTADFDIDGESGDIGTRTVTAVF